MIETYTDLQNAIPEWIANEKVRTVAKDCIQLAEARIRNDILIRRMERAVHGTFDGAVIFLPEDCDAVQRLMYYRGEAEISIRFMDPKGAERYTGATGDPVGYTFADQALILYPTPATASAYTLYYVPTLADLSDAKTTNWLLDRSPNVYLNAACLEAALFLGDKELAGVWEGRYKQASDALFQASERQRMPSNTPMVARPFRTLRSRRT